MAKIIGLSGPQGGGKTTLLNGLKERGYEVDEFKVSRAVQQALGWSTLENVLESVETMTAFQQKIIELKHERETLFDDLSDKIILTERTFADIAAYTQLWTWELVAAKKWTIVEGMDFTLPFVEACSRFQHDYSGNLILPAMPHVKWESDPHRADKKHTEFISEQLDRFFELKHPKNVPTFRITAASVQDRINQVDNWIKTL